MEIDEHWSFEEAVEESFRRYVGVGKTSRGYRNSLLKAWGGMVGRTRAVSGLERTIAQHGGPEAAGAALGLSEYSLGSLRKFFSGLPARDHDELDHQRPYQSCFISHSSKDKPFARRLHEALRSKGVRCWFDEHALLPGQDLHEEIDKGIRAYDKLLLICSENSLKDSWWVDAEITTALEREQQLMRERGEKALCLIPLDLDGYLFTGNVHGKAATIRSRVAGDFKGWETDDEKFEREVERLLKGISSSPRMTAAAGPSPPGRQAPPNLILQVSDGSGRLTETFVNGIITNVLGSETACRLVQFEKRGGTTAIRLEASSAADLAALSDAFWGFVPEGHGPDSSEDVPRLLEALRGETADTLEDLRGLLERMELRLPSEDVIEMQEDKAAEHIRAKDTKLVREWGQKAARAVGGAVVKKLTGLPGKVVDDIGKGAIKDGLDLGDE